MNMPEFNTNINRPFSEEENEEMLKSQECAEILEGSIDEVMDKGYSVMSVYCNADLLPDPLHSRDGRFIGGVIAKVNGSNLDKWAMLYQLVKAVYIRHKDLSIHNTADMFLDKFVESLKNGEDMFVISPFDLMMMQIKKELKEEQQAQNGD